MHYLPILSTIITFVFAAAVFSRFRVRHGAHLLLWSIGLVLYGIGTLTEVVCCSPSAQWLSNYGTCAARC